MANIGDRVIGTYEALNMRALVDQDGEWVTLRGPRVGELGWVLAPGGNYRDDVAVLRYTEEMDRRVVELVDLLAEVRRATGMVQLPLTPFPSPTGGEGLEEVVSG